MSPVLGLVARIAKGEHNQFSYGDIEYRRVHHDDDDDDDRLPWWAILLIVYFSILLTVFLVSFIYYWQRQRERARDGQPFRASYVLWKAFSTATGIAVWIWLFKRLGWCGADRKNDRAAGVGPYEKIRSRQLHSAAGAPASTAGSSSAPSTNPNASAWYGAPASPSTTYTSHDHPYGASKSPRFNPAHQNFAQHDSIPMITLSPSPNPSSGSPSPSPSPKPSQKHTPPPPYISSPPPAALYGQNFQAQYTGPAYQHLNDDTMKEAVRIG
ncbi:hypothetical protein EKO27_g2258 [Xylaria grammica]|uniref:Uncharacterized protein n=1 Tax=Xylaria grammica TaxID=363999 RepID=A0A439DEM2_9PEZI|nr:hypothetical protein EKO27_g2258 [Xylaria grammica]